MYCLIFKNQELQISNPCGCQQQQQQHPKEISLTVSALTHNITTFLGENKWPGTTKFCLKIMWTAVPVSLNMKCTDRFSCVATQFLVINAAPASCAMRKATAIARWMTQSSSLSFWRPPQQKFASAASICLVTEIIMSSNSITHAHNRTRHHACHNTWLTKRSRS